METRSRKVSGREGSGETPCVRVTRADNRLETPSLNPRTTQEKAKRHKLYEYQPKGRENDTVKGVAEKRAAEPMKANQ